jgi:FMN phosphatase YigB (HAD superfamily)
VLERLGARPEQALHVGDVPELDLAGAAGAGIAARLVDRSGVLDERYGAWPDLRPLPAAVGLTNRWA